MRVIGRRSSINVRKVLWACDEAGVDYVLDDSIAPRTPALLALNPNGLIPVVIDGDAVLWESNTIVRYVAAKAARTDLLPEAPLARARVEQWMDWQATELNPSWRYAFLALARRAPGYGDTARIDASCREWNAMMALLDGQLERTGAFVAGNAFTVADIVVGLSVHRWLHTPIARPALPAVAAYVDRLRARPHYAVHAQPTVP